MKKYFALILVTCLLSIGAMAQVPAFMGIPIEGDINAFYTKLEAKGFVIETLSDDGNIYTGKFTGEDVTVEVMPGYENEVAMVGVYLPIQSTWSGALSDFEKYNKMYTTKYGEPDFVTREYDGLTPGTTAFHNALESGEAVYLDTYVEDNILITIGVHEAVISDTSDGYQILILYFNGGNFIDEEEVEVNYSDEI